MSKTVAIFSGQGAQYPGMGKELFENFAYVREIYECASDILGYDLAKISFDGSEEELTAYAQTCIFALSVSAFSAAEKEAGGFKPECVAGHSLGEYAALCCAGAFSLEDGFRIVKARMQAMLKAANPENSAMYAIIGLDEPTVEEVCQSVDGFVVPANYNLPAQTVISGESKACEKAAENFSEKGAKVIRLNVSGAFHTKLMQPAADELKVAISGISFQKTRLVFYSNVTANAAQIDNYPEYFAKHMVSGVRFVEEVAAMADGGVDICVEFGPKKSASQLVKKNAKTIQVFNVEDMASLNKLTGAFA